MIQDHKQSGNRMTKEHMLIMLEAPSDAASTRAEETGMEAEDAPPRASAGASSPLAKSPNEDSQHKSGGELRDKQDNPSLNAAQKSGAGYGYYKGRSGADREA